MMKLPFLFLIAILGCNAPDHPTVKTEQHRVLADSTKPITTALTAKSIEDVVNYKWQAPQSDNTSGMTVVEFRDEYAMLWFNGQCVYFFFTTTYSYNADEVQLEWTYKTDCITDMSFLESSNGVKSFPRTGDHFATYRLINDSTLSVEYKFPQWVDKVNRIAEADLFPQRLHILHPES